MGHAAYFLSHHDCKSRDRPGINPPGWAKGALGFGVEEMARQQKSGEESGLTIDSKTPQSRCTLVNVPADDELSAIEFLNDSEERSRSRVSQFAKDAIAAISTVVPPVGVFLGAIENALDRREASNRAELFSALVERIRQNSAAIGELIEKSEAHSRFFTKEFPGLVVEAVRRAETVRPKERIRRFAAILAHSVEVGPKDGADYVEEMLRIAAELSDWDVKVLATAASEFVSQRNNPIPRVRGGPMLESDQVIAARAWIRMNSGVSGYELASIGAKLQSFGLVSRIEGQTGETNSFQVLGRGGRFIEYVGSAA